ncbi:MAG TPA: biopolymer transporter ExbD [Burkholderiales bacterium]|jgi:biopolymer transport protein ExbD|nr:biopolymer transporter ExbD [Burkholderiales bacterium]
MNFQRGRYKEEPEINLVPLIDVMMVILIFLMITTTYSKYTELKINLPTAEAERQQERPNEISVLVGAQGQYVINKAPVQYSSVEQLAAELRRAGEGLREPIVIISADRVSNWQAVVRVMEAARVAGLSQITFTTQSAR